MDVQAETFAAHGVALNDAGAKWQAEGSTLNYEVLTGKDVLAELVISDAHLRLRCEQELKNLLLRMQSAFLRQNHHATALLESVRASYSAFQRCLRTAIRVYGDPLPDDERETVSLAAKKLGLDREVIERIEETCGVDSSITVAAR